MPEPSDLTRLQREYAARAERLAGDTRYSFFNPAHLFMIQGRQREMLRLLTKQGLHSLTDLMILEVGCGTGGFLAELLALGGTPDHLFGVELILARLKNAQARLSHLPLACADGQNLPFPEQTFDLLIQATVFSSILDLNVQQHLAAELLRLARKPGGVILWYDFWLNPFNTETKGLRREDIRNLFPGCNIIFRQITLAPPLIRFLSPHFLGLASALEKVRLLNSHYLALIQPV